MKNFFYIVPLLVVLLSCDEVSFKEPQPKGRKSLASVPDAIRGKYILVENGKEPSKDTIIVGARGFRFGYFEPGEREQNGDEGFFKGGLGDSLILRTYKGYYFWNFNEEPEWRLRVVRKENNSNLTILEPGKKDVDFKGFIKELDLIVDVDTSTVKGEKLYQIDPSAKELVKLIEKGYFTETVLRKVD